MQPTPPVRRRTQASRVMPPPQEAPRAQKQEQPEVPVRKKKSKKSVFFALIGFVLVLALIVLVSPKEPLTRAIYTGATAADGVVSAGKSNIYEGLVISEVMASNGASVPDDKGEYSDWVEIWNSSDQPISLHNVGLSDRGDSIRFLFPDVILQPDGRVIVYCTDTNQVEAGKDYHAKFKISSVGETLYLFDPNAYTIDKVDTPVLNSDEVYALQADGKFAVSEHYSPGFANSEEGFQAYLAATMVATGELIINEVMADPLSGLADADGEFVDWVELHNTTDRTIYLSNYALSDKVLLAISMLSLQLVCAWYTPLCLPTSKAVEAMRRKRQESTVAL